MRIIKIFDSGNYRAEWGKIKRDSVRAIIVVDGKLLMIRSKKYGEYKFPGGGIETGESHLDALVREVKEEAGLHALPETVREYGRTLILRKGFNQDEIFEQESFYYTCDVDMATQSSPTPDEGYETEYGYHPVFVSLEEAIEVNHTRTNMPEIPWVERELYVLMELRANHH